MAISTAVLDNVEARLSEALGIIRRCRRTWTWADVDRLTIVHQVEAALNILKAGEIPKDPKMTS